MRGLGEEIAVLDGIPSNYTRRHVIDPSAGGNYSGGSSWNPEVPLTPSNSGLAQADDDLLEYYEKMNVIDPSAGANMSGGSSWDSHMPLTPSNAGLAYFADMGGMYDGKPVEDMDKNYGSTMGSLEAANLPGYYRKGPSIDPSAGANYNGGSSYADMLPLTPSNAGLAAFNIHPMDRIPDSTFLARLTGPRRSVFVAAYGQLRLENVKKSLAAARRIRNHILEEGAKTKLLNIRRVRGNILASRSPGAMPGRQRMNPTQAVAMLFGGKKAAAMKAMRMAKANRQDTAPSPWR